MGNNKALDQRFFTIAGATKSSGGTNHIAKGQLAFADQKVGTNEGAQVISTFNGKPKKDRRFTLRVGITDNGVTKSTSNKSLSTDVFAINDIVGLTVSAPKQTEQIMDELTIGYDGINPETSFKFKTGDPYFRISVGVSGEPISYLGGGVDNVIASANIEIPSCDPFNTCDDCDNCDVVDCKAITLEAIEVLKRTAIGGDAVLEDVVEITPIFECATPVTATLIPYDYYTLEVCDAGTQGALALVQAQYNAPVKQLDRVGGLSTYQVLLPQASGAPADYVQSIASLIKGCDTCPAGYTAVAGGLLYAFSIEDDGVDKTSLITALPNYVANTVERGEGHAFGIGFYTAVFSAELTDVQIATFLGGAVPSNTATVHKIGEVSAICTNSSTTTTAWDLGDTCNAVSEDYVITLADTQCGDDRLAELQNAYPSLDVTILTEDSLNSKRTVTLTGSSGTANISIGGTDYLATFASNLTTTAANFVTTHAATLLALGTTVTASGAILTFTHATIGFPTIVAPANATGNLAGTLQALTVIPQNVVGGCKTKYVASVVSNLVCDNCDPIYNDYYRTDAPAHYEGNEWVKQANAGTSPSGSCLCGIRIKGKSFVMNPSEPLRDQVAFVEAGTLVNASAGYPVEVREGIGMLPKGQYDANYVRRFTPRTHLGGHLLGLERESLAFFAGTSYSKDYLRKVFRGETSNIEDLQTQYVHYTLKVSNFNHSGGFGATSFSDKNYSIYVEVGRHQAIEDLLNNLASNANIEPVKAFAI
jgi:hypothetical protein